jgi:hypothetical protein
MDHKIDAGVARIQNRKMVRRRLTLSLGATAMIVAGVFMFPAVQAQASLGGMMSALDKETSAKIITYAVSESGMRFPIGTTIVANGNIEMLDSKNAIKQVDIDNDSYSFDSTTNAYIQRSRRQTEGIRMSQLLGPASRLAFKKRVETQRISRNGKEIIRAVVTDQGLPERYVIEADAKSQLPFHVQVESLEMGNWRIRQDMEFQYEPGLKVSKPDFSKTPILTEDQNERNFIQTMTSTSLGSIKGKNRTVIVRRVDIADDGTVFVAFQSGDHQRNSWSGYHLKLADSLGTSYIHAGDILDNYRNRGLTPKEGKLELEVFVPIKQIPSNTKRDLTISVATDQAGNIDSVFDVELEEKGLTKNGVNYPDGHVEMKTFPRQGGQAMFKTLVQKAYSGSTCTARPSWSSGIAWELGNDVFAEIFKARWSAKHAMETESWADAEWFLNAELHWKRESEVQGLSPWEMESTLKNLEIVKKHLQPN